MDFLQHVRDETLPAWQEKFDSDQFYRSREGLFVSGAFRAIVVADAQPLTPKPQLDVSLFTLTSRADGVKIQAELPAGCIFMDTSTFGCCLAAAIEAQAHGREGALLSNGFESLFCVCPIEELIVAMVSVRWSFDLREWSIDGTKTSRHPWGAYSRVFSAAPPRLSLRFLTLLQSPYHVCGVFLFLF